MKSSRSILAGITGVLCAVAVLVFIGSFQGGLALATPSMNSATAPASPYVNSQSQSNQTKSPGGSLFGANVNNAWVPLGPQSSQSIQSPFALLGAAVLIGISLAVSVGIAFLVSRRNA